MTTNPSLEDFLCTARREFGFLTSEFGYTEQPDTRKHPNPFCVCYASSFATVIVEGINWGFGIQVMLNCLAPAARFPSRVPLWAIVELRAPHEGETVSGQLEQLAREAFLLRTYAVDVLRGDFTSFPAAKAIIERRAAEAVSPKHHKLP